MITEKNIKQLAFDLGADLCGIAPVRRFEKAPRGFHPEDIFPEAKSVVVIAKRFPEGPFYSQSPIPYTVVKGVILNEVIRITCLLCVRIEQRGNAVAVPIPSEPYEYWDETKREGRGLLSLKHAGYLAGLGVIGKNFLLTNKEYGNRITLGAVLLNLELEGDSVADYEFCSEKCRLCIDACPVHAIGRLTVNQKFCRSNCEGQTKKGNYLILCSKCMKICPNGKGIRTFSNP